MIKINLSTAQKQLDMANVGGFDFSKIKINLVLIAIVSMYLPDFVIVPLWEDSFNKKTEELGVLQMELNSVKRKVSSSGALEKQIRDLKAQEEDLRQKLSAVKEAISQKRNPAKLLLYMAKNIPDDLWLQELSLDNELMTIKGEALSYVSVGNFVNSLRSSIFVKEANIKNTTSKVRETDKRRIENFEIVFTVARFDQ